MQRGRRVERRRRRRRRRRRVRAPVRAGMRGGCGPETAGPPHTTAGGRGRVGAGGSVSLGPGDLGAAPERRTSLGSRAPAPRMGEGRVGDSGGRGARTRASVHARQGLFIRAGARALCGPLGARGRCVRVPGPDISVPGAAARRQKRLSGARARPPATPGFGARAVLLGGGAAARARRCTSLLRVGAAGGRLAVWGGLRVGPFLLW